MSDFMYVLVWAPVLAVLVWALRIHLSRVRREKESTGTGDLLKRFEQRLAAASRYPSFPPFRRQKQLRQLGAALGAIDIGLPQQAKALAEFVIDKPANKRLLSAAHGIAALAAAAQSRYEDAAKHYGLGAGEDASKKNPQRLAGLAFIHMRMGNFSAPEALLARAEMGNAMAKQIALSVRYATASLIGNYEDALHWLDQKRVTSSPRAMERNANLPAVELSCRAECLNYLQRSGEALPLIQTALTTINPTHKTAIIIRARLGLTLAQLERRTEALAALQTAAQGLASIPEDIQTQREALTILAVASARLGDHTVALAYLRRSMECQLSPIELARTYWRLAESYRSLGMFRERRDVLETGAATLVPTLYREWCINALSDLRAQSFDDS